MPPADASLVSRARAGDRSAFLLLVDRHYPTLLSLCRRLDLIPTGGSDYHGQSSLSASPFGGRKVPVETIERLRALAVEPIPGVEMK